MIAPIRWCGLVASIACTAFFGGWATETPRNVPVLYKHVEVPPDFCRTAEVDGEPVRFGGDIRMGDLTGDGVPDFIVYRSVEDAHDGGGMKPCFLGAFTLDGKALWSTGEGGEQPSRPGPVAIHDIDGDGQSEVVHFWHVPDIEAKAGSMADVCLQIRDGKTGELERAAAPEPFRACTGHGPNWVHQRILLADFRGLGTPGDFVVKLGARVLAFDGRLNLLWQYTSPWTAYGHCPAYIPSVGDLDADGKDEVNGGYFMLDDDGTVRWQGDIARHMDSVAVRRWDNGNMRAICSGFGHVLDADGNVILKLGKDEVPHGQEVRTGWFTREAPGPQMVLRFNAHTPVIKLVDSTGTVLRTLEINPTRNNTGMETVWWRDRQNPALLYNGGRLWDLETGGFMELPGLPEPRGVGRMAWYHCIPANVCGDAREEVVLYNPWSTKVYIYTPAPLASGVFEGYAPGPRQYNVRLMD